MQKFSTSEAVKTGWQVFEKNRWFAIRLALIGIGFSIVSNYISNTSDLVRGPTALVLMFTSIALSIINILLHIGFLKFGLSLVNGERPRMKDLLSYIDLFWKFLGGAIVYGAVVGLVFLIGLSLIILLSLFFHSKLVLAMIILPALAATILAMQYFFVFPLVVDQGLGPIKAMKKSAELTKGIRIDLFGFTVVAIVINILGAIFLLVGLLVSVPVTFFAYLAIYRSLTRGTPSPIQSVPVAPKQAAFTPSEVPVHPIS